MNALEHTHPDVIARYLSRVVMSDGCWSWTGAVHTAGYAQFRVGRDSRFYGHRVSYELHVGPIPDGLEIDHLCQNPICTNPEHLEAVTHVENTKRIATRMHGCRKYGHDWSDPSNVYVRKNGQRFCRVCSRMANRAFRERLKATQSENEADKVLHGTVRRSAA